MSIKKEIRDLDCTVIVPAAGQGKRFGNSLPKQFLDLNGIPVIIRTLKIFEDMDEVNNVIVAVDTSYKKLLQNLIKEFDIKKNISIIKGGKERQDSIFNAIKLQSLETSDIILVHDAVRPLASKKLFTKIVNATNTYGSSVPGIVPKDTIKRIKANGFVDCTFMRHMLRNIQTPQGFKTDIFLEIYRQMKLRKMVVTDDSALAEMLGFKVKIIEGEEQNIKITTAIDMLLACSILINEKSKIKS